MTQKARSRAAGLRPAASRKILRSGLPLVIGVACVWLLRDKLHGLDLQAVADVVRGTSPMQWALAAMATAVSFWAIGTYDMVMHRHLRTGVSPQVARVTGAASIALAQVLGLGMVTGALARWRMLSGARPGMAAAVTGAVALSFMAAWGLIAVGLAAMLPGVSLPIWITALTGCIAIGAMAVAFLYPTVRVGPLTLRLPSLRALSAMTVLTALDVAAAALALYILLPSEVAIGYEVLLPVFALALGAGLFSSTPGGAGPFELTMLALLPQVADAPLLGAILAWRVVYYALPALFALIPLAFPFRVTEQVPFRRAAQCSTLPRASRAECGVARQNGAELVETATGHAMVVETGQTLTLLFDPVTGQAESVIPALKAAARDRMLVPVIYKCSGKLAAAAKKSGWHVLRVADDAVVDLAGFSIDGSRFRQLRRKLRQAEKAGVTTQREEPTTALLDELARIDAHWVAEHGGARGFSMGRYCPDYVGVQQIYVARQDGRAIAFVTLHETTRDLALDLMRYGDDLPDGTMHLLIATAIADAQAEGRARLTLAAMPARDVAERRIVSRMRTRIAQRSGGDGLTRFKESFGPRRQPLYMAAPNPMSITLASADLARTVHREAA